MDRGEFVSRTEAEQTTFGEVIRRYMEIPPPALAGHAGDVEQRAAPLLPAASRLAALWRGKFVWWASYASSAADALKDERELAIVANAFEDFGGYCQRTGENCAAASFRETERKLAKARIRRYQFLPGIRIEERIPEVILRTCGNERFSDEGRGSRSKEPCSNPAELWKMNASTP